MAPGGLPQGAREEKEEEEGAHLLPTRCVPGWASVCVLLFSCLLSEVPGRTLNARLFRGCLWDLPLSLCGFLSRAFAACWVVSVVLVLVRVRVCVCFFMVGRCRTWGLVGPTTTLLDCSSSGCRFMAVLCCG